jgi:hypothetical protein
LNLSVLSLLIFPFLSFIPVLYLSLISSAYLSFSFYICLFGISYPFFAAVFLCLVHTSLHFILNQCIRIYHITNSVAPEPEGSSPHSQQPATGPYPEPGESTSTPHPPILPKIHFDAILPPASRSLPHFLSDFTVTLNSNIRVHKLCNVKFTVSVTHTTHVIETQVASCAIIGYSDKYFVVPPRLSKRKLRPRLSPSKFIFYLILRELQLKERRCKTLELMINLLSLNVPEISCCKCGNAEFNFIDSSVVYILTCGMNPYSIALRDLHWRKAVHVPVIIFLPSFILPISWSLYRKKLRLWSNFYYLLQNGINL